MELDELIATQNIDNVDTPKEDVFQYDKRGELKKLIDQGDAHLLHGNNGKKWTIECINKATDKQIDNIWSKHNQEENKQKADKTFLFFHLVFYLNLVFLIWSLFMLVI